MVASKCHSRPPTKVVRTLTGSNSTPKARIQVSKDSRDMVVELRIQASRPGKVVPVVDRTTKGTVSSRLP